MPKFSIAIPAHNRREFLAQAVASCQLQTIEDFEVVVSDDCSTDDLGAVVRGFGDTRVRHDRSPERLGAAKNHQRAVELAKGQYVITLNSDDLLLPECLEVAGSCLDRNAERGAVFFSPTYLNDGNVEGFNPVPRVLCADAEALAANPWLEKYHGTAPSCCLFRKIAFERIAGYRTFLRFAYDWDFFMRMMRFGGGVLFLPEILVVYRRHEEQMVQQHSIDALKDVLDLWVLPEYRLWPAHEIATIALNEARSHSKTGQSPWLVIKAIADSGSTWRTAGGLPRAICAKLFRLRNASEDALSSNCQSPNNVEARIKAAKELVCAVATKVIGPSQGLIN